MVESKTIVVIGSVEMARMSNGGLIVFSNNRRTMCFPRNPRRATSILLRHVRRARKGTENKRPSETLATNGTLKLVRKGDGSLVIRRGREDYAYPCDICEAFDMLCEG